MSFLMQAAVQEAGQGRGGVAMACAATQRKIAEKMLLRVRPHAKRIACRACGAVLVVTSPQQQQPATATTKVRLRVRRGAVVVRSCRACGAVLSRFPMPPMAKKAKTAKAETTTTITTITTNSSRTTTTTTT
jgi:RNase P subunit RPR2